jgi:hypothetical protein
MSREGCFADAPNEGRKRLPASSAPQSQGIRRLTAIFFVVTTTPYPSARRAGSLCFNTPRSVQAVTRLALRGTVYGQFVP